MLPDLLLDTGTSGQEACGNDHCRFAFGAKGIDDMLQEHQINRHLILVLVGNVRDARPKAFLIIIASQCIPAVREVHVKRRIADNIVKRGKPVAFGVFVIRPQQSIVMYDIGQRVDEIIENQVQAQELVGLLGDVLGIDGAVAFADFVGQCQHQCARACGWVIHRHILCAVRYHDFCNDAGDGMWRIVFGVLTEILIVVLNQILEYLSKEIVLLLKHTIEAAFSNLVDDSTAEIVLLLSLNHMLGDTAEQAHLGLAASPDRKDVDVVCSNIQQCIIKDHMKIFFILTVEQVRDKMSLLQFCSIRVKTKQEQFIVIIGHLGELLFGICRGQLCQRRLYSLRFEKELVVEELVKENLSDDLVLAGGIAQTKIGTYGLQTIDHLLGL